MTDLRALALAATPGPWHWHQQPDGLTGCGRNWWVESDDEADIGDMQRYADAAFIAAASPAVVLALLDCIAAADEVVHWQVRSSSTDDDEQRYFDARDRLAEVMR